MTNFKQNLFVAFIYAAIGIPIVAIAFSSVSVVLNALRIGLKR